MTKKQTTPGEILQEEFLVPLKLTQKKLAGYVGCDAKTINRIIKGHTRVTTRIAVKLGKVFNTSTEFWLKAQMAVDIDRLKEF